MTRLGYCPRVLLADDHAMVADGFGRILQPEFQLVGTVGDGRALLAAAERLRPDVVVTDISMPMLNGIEAARQLKKANPRVKVIVLSMHADVDFVTEAIQAGASGYLLKHCASDELPRAIREALGGRLYVTPQVAQDRLYDFTQAARQPEKPALRLTRRQREVLQLVAEGRRIKKIAAVMDIAIRTVAFHKANIMDKLGVRTTAELTQYAVKRGIVSL